MLTIQCRGCDALIVFRGGSRDYKCAISGGYVRYMESCPGIFEEQEEKGQLTLFDPSTLKEVRTWKKQR